MNKKQIEIERSLLQDDNRYYYCNKKHLSNNIMLSRLTDVNIPAVEAKTIITTIKNQVEQGVKV